MRDVLLRLTGTTILIGYLIFILHFVLFYILADKIYTILLKEKELADKYLAKVKAETEDK